MTFPLLSRHIALLTAVAALIAAARTLAAQVKVPANASGVLGVVIDSIHGGGIGGATVLIEGTSLSGMSDRGGEFKFDSVPPGTRRFVLRHPLVDSIGLDIVSAPIELAAGRVAIVALAVPSAKTLRRLLCQARDTTTDLAIIRGRVHDPETDSSIAGARVSFAYNQLNFSKDSGIKRDVRLRETTTRKDGTYTLCGLPIDVAGTLMAVYQGVTTPEVPIHRGRDEIVFRDLAIPQSVATLDVARSDSAVVSPLPAAPAPSSAITPIAPAASARTDSSSPPTVRRVRLTTGKATLEGRVIATDSAGIADVQVAVAGTTQHTSTRADGSFTLENLPSGTSEVFARKIGFRPGAAIVDLTSRAPTRTTIMVSKTSPTLEPVTVVASMSARLQHVGFTDRRRMGLGRYIDAEGIARRQPMQITDIIHFFPGFRIVEAEFGRTIEPTRSVSQQSAHCVNLFIDHALWDLSEPGDLDRALNVNEIAAVETYAGGYVPQEFAVPTKNCATIVIWTKTKLDEK